jgi:hypothetical protein
MRLVYLQQLMQLPNLVHLDQSFIRDINNKYGLGGGGRGGLQRIFQPQLIEQLSKTTPTRKKKSRKALKGKKKGLRNEVMDGKLMNLTFFHRSFHMYNSSSHKSKDYTQPCHFALLYSRRAYVKNHIKILSGMRANLINFTQPRILVLFSCFQSMLKPIFLLALGFG